MDITTSPPTGKEKDHAILDSSKDSIPDEELNNDISNLNIQESAAGPGINITDTEVGIIYAQKSPRTSIGATSKESLTKLSNEIF